MRIGIPREVKPQEYRVAMTPAGVHELVVHGHEVVVESGSGAASALVDDDYRSAGARVVPTPDAVWGWADLVLKVKEPLAEEYPRMRPGQVLFTYLHLAASRACTEALVDRQVTAVAYETVQLADGTLPLLVPMSEIAGRLAPQVGAQALMSTDGGRGVLLAGVPGVRPAKVAVLGAGHVGRNAARIAVGMGAEVTVLDRNLVALRAAEELDGLRTLASGAYEIERAVLESDLVIGAVLVPGALAPRLVSDDLVRGMKPGSVLVDVSIDQGGCLEGSRPTTHEQPTYRVHDSLFYCVPNMPGVVPHTATHALANATLPYVLQIASKGWRQAMRDDPALARGLNTHAGAVTCAPVAQAHGLPLADLATVIADGPH